MTAFQPPRYILAPYLPTAPDVVERMLDLAGVAPGDIVLDLGCGDGRLAIAAALRGAEALGVDIEAHWVECARRNAEAAGVALRARFVQQDALAVDPSAASVVLLYLVEWSAQRVAQSLLQRCRPGTRVVSNSFGLAQSGQTQCERFEDAGGQSRCLHLWIVPGDPERASSC
jgi:precorrin-6B methylase 2